MLHLVAISSQCNKSLAPATDPHMPDACAFGYVLRQRACSDFCLPASWAHGGGGTQQETGARLHGDAGGGLAVEAAADDGGQRGVAQRGHGDAVRLVGDGVHLLDELQRREGRVPVHHLVQDAAQAPHI